MLRLLLTATLMVFFVKAPAQDCTDFHLGQCEIPDFSYYYNQQSKSLTLSVARSKELQIVAYENTDYFISVCKHRKFDVLQFKIFEDSEPRTLIYDNAENSYSETLKFTNEATRRLVIELTLPEDKNDDTKTRCVGVLIATRMHQK
ncbi:MAG: hypothetical protein ACOC10_08115 [Bacteroidota bacterium]